jgi:hypothetical protein
MPEIFPRTREQVQSSRKREHGYAVPKTNVAKPKQKITVHFEAKLRTCRFIATKIPPLYNFITISKRWYHYGLAIV